MQCTAREVLHRLCEDSKKPKRRLKCGPFDAEQCDAFEAEVDSAADVEAAAWKCIDTHFLPIGTPVYLKELPNKLAAFSGRSGLINNKRKEGFLYSVQLHGFFGEKNEVKEFFLDIPPTHLELQVGMNDMLCFNHDFEKQMMKHGMMPPGQPTKMPRPVKVTIPPTGDY
mmetsp:Transcript_36513/g.60485  ORF Transcript_36513/g.60485 Transcript_36513/m.60485 type:complete len:169 (+) Transcript_36513:35-541(+)